MTGGAVGDQDRRMQGLSVGGINAGWLGFGAAGIGSLYRAVDDATAAAVVDAAWGAGIRYFDTAPHYGLGLSERRLGDALADRPRDDFVGSSKVGRLLIDTPERAAAGVLDDAQGFIVPATHRRRWDFSRDGVMRSVEDLSVEETAECLSIPPETVRSRHFRARSLLRESLARDLDLAERDLFDFAGARCDQIVARVLAQIH